MVGTSTKVTASSFGQGCANCGLPVSQIHLPPVFVQLLKLMVLAFSKCCKKNQRCDYATNMACDPAKPKIVPV